MKREIKTEDWIELSNREICKEFDIGETIEAGLSGRYTSLINYQVMDGKVYMKKKEYDKKPTHKSKKTRVSK